MSFDEVLDRRATESSKWRRYPPDVLPLWVADMDFRAPEPVIRVLQARVAHGVFGYGDVGPELAEVVCARLERLHGWKVAPEALVVIPGVIPGFNLVARAAAAPGEGIVIQTPAYPPILRVPGNVGLRLDGVPLAREPDGRYVVDLDRVAAALRPDTRLFLLCNPHNPVGRVFTRAELEGLAELCLRHGLVVCADEVHSDLVYRGHRHLPIAALAPEVAARTVTLLAPSKGFNLPGLKCAVAVIPDRALRERFVAAQVDLVRAVNVLGYVAMLAAYRDGQPWLEALLAYLEANRDALAAEVRARLPGVTLVSPEGTYLAWLDCRAAGPAAADPHTFFLERARVALNDGRTFGPGGEGFVRLNFGCPRAILAEALERMGAALAAA